jgi:DUF971 family protein
MNNPFSQKHKPIEIRLNREEKVLEVDFDDGSSFALPAELLRVESPSAEVQGHGPGQKKLVTGRRHVGIMGIETVGNYAIRINFDDLHDTGIYSWDTLYTYGDQKEKIWGNYLKALNEAGQTREPK